MPSTRRLDVFECHGPPGMFWVHRSAQKAVAMKDPHFGAITRGVIDLRDVFYFLSIMIAFLGANAILVDLEKAE